MNQVRSGVSSSASWSWPSFHTTKKPAAKSQPVHQPAAFFSDLFNVAASRPAKSPRDKSPLDLARGLRQCATHAMPTIASTSWEATMMLADRHPSGSRHRSGCGSRRARAERPLDDDQMQPASLDLRLGATACRVRASFLPGPAIGSRTSSTASSCMRSISPTAPCWRPAASISCR